MLASEYMRLTETMSPGDLGDLVAMLPDERKILLYDELSQLGCKKLVQTLWYNYETQTLLTLNRS